MRIVDRTNLLKIIKAGFQIVKVKKLKKSIQSEKFTLTGWDEYGTITSESGFLKEMEGHRAGIYLGSKGECSDIELDKLAMADFTILKATSCDNGKEEYRLHRYILGHGFEYYRVCFKHYLYNDYISQNKILVIFE